MDLRLVRTEFGEHGVFGTLLDINGNQIAFTLEHSYQQPDSTWRSKLMDGTYICVRGQHQLANMTHPFETFEITNVPGHTNILIHVGNYNDDSEGCVLVGLHRDTAMILNSRMAFGKFMDLENGSDKFTLTVSSTI